MSSFRWLRVLAPCAAGAVIAACDGTADTPFEAGAESERPLVNLACRISPDNLFAGGPGRDGIPALVNPPLVALSDADARYVDEYVRLTAGDATKVEARVVALEVDGVAVAVPHNILWWHEIVNLDLGGRRLAVTYCPLTGSALVFDATAAGTRRFGVSGLIFQNNLVMFDEETESLWPQMCREATFGPLDDTRLVEIPAIEMRWESWKARHPDGVVVGGNTGHVREYTRYPYDFYEETDFLLFPQSSIDPRRDTKERVFGVPDEDGGLAFPFAELAKGGPTTAVSTVIGGETILVLWDTEAAAAAAFLPRTIDGRAVSLMPDGDGFVDRETGSRWNVEGVATSGPLAGTALEPRIGGFVAYWFAWSAFHPGTRIWTQE